MFNEYGSTPGVVKAFRESLPCRLLTVILNAPEFIPLFNGVTSIRSVLTPGIFYPPLGPGGHSNHPEISSQYLCPCESSSDLWKTFVLYILFLKTPVLFGLLANICPPRIVLLGFWWWFRQFFRLRHRI